MRRAIPSLAAAAALACALTAPPALAGQVVWLKAAPPGGAIWAANDDGTYPHRLVSAGGDPLASQFPHGVLADPEVFQNGGSTVLFTDTNGAFAAPGSSTACADPCTRALSLKAGVLSDPLPQPASPGAEFQAQPRLTSSGQIVTQYALYPRRHARLARHRIAAGPLRERPGRERARLAVGQHGDRGPAAARRPRP